MRLLTLFLHAFILNQWWATATPVIETRADGIDQGTYDDLVRYTKYSSAVYQWICLYPLGNTLVKQFSESWTQGFVVRDDTRKEIVVAFRGTLEIADAFVDLQIIMKPLQSKGLSGIGDSYVHTGFLFAYNVVADIVLSNVKSQLASYPTYSVVVTGTTFTWWGSRVSGCCFNKSAHPSVPLKLYTFGQPRTGNAAYASYVEQKIGVANIFRAVHTYDGVPTILFKALGYRHHGTEYWNFQEFPNPGNVRKCSGSDNPACSDSIPSTFINPAHLIYFNQAMALNPLLCI